MIFYCFDSKEGLYRAVLKQKLCARAGIIESTPAVWHGWIYVGTRDGGIYGIANGGR